MIKNVPENLRYIPELAMKKLPKKIEEELREYQKQFMQEDTKQIGGTMYVVRVHFNEDAKETMKDKIKRLIENDVRGTQHTA